MEDGGTVLYRRKLIQNSSLTTWIPLSGLPVVGSKKLGREIFACQFRGSLLPCGAGNKERF